MTGGDGVDRSVASVYEGSREGAHCVQHDEGNWVAALGTLWSPESTPAASYGGRGSSGYGATVNQKGREGKERSRRTVCSP